MRPNLTTCPGARAQLRKSESESLPERASCQPFCHVSYRERTGKHFTARRLSQDKKIVSHCIVIHNCRGKRNSPAQKNTIKPPEKTDSLIA